MCASTAHNNVFLVSFWAGASCYYAWDEPTGRRTLALSLPAAGVRFQCQTNAVQLRRPRLARLLGRAHVELRVANDPTLTRVVLTEVAAGLSTGNISVYLSIRLSIYRSASIYL